MERDQRYRSEEKQTGIRLTLCWLLNMADVFFTILLVREYGMGIEGNPLGRILLEAPLLTVVFKTAIYVPLWIWRENKYAKISSWVILIAYAGLNIYHLVIIGWVKFMI